jgi:hypothetical protein
MIKCRTVYSERRWLEASSLLTAGRYCSIVSFDLPARSPSQYCSIVVTSLGSVARCDANRIAVHSNALRTRP